MPPRVPIPATNLHLAQELTDCAWRVQALVERQAGGDSMINETKTASEEPEPVYGLMMLS